MTDLPNTLELWKRGYVEGTVSLGELEAVLEHYFETGCVKHHPQIHGHIPHDMK